MAKFKLIFKTKIFIAGNKKTSYSFTDNFESEYESLNDLKEDLEILKSEYENRKRPVFYYHGKIDWEKSEDGSCLYAWTIIDYEKEKFIDFGDKVLFKSNKLERMDEYFRKPDEIPDDYEWDIGEYEGWLQFRWGDGKNAILPKETKKPINKNTKENIIPEVDEFEYIDDKFQKMEENRILKSDPWLN